MKKIQKTMFILSAIFALIGGIVSLIAFIAIVGYPSFTPYVLTNVLNELGYTISLDFVQQFYVAFAIGSALMIFVNVWIMFVAFNLSFSKQPVTLSSIGIVTLIIAWLFGNIICAITFSVGLFLKPANQSVLPNQEQVITKEIQDIRILYQQGAITKEEYDKLVKELFNHMKVS